MRFRDIEPKIICTYTISVHNFDGCNTKCKFHLVRTVYISDAGTGGAGGAVAPPMFGRIERGGGSGGVPHYYLPPQYFSPSGITE